MPPITHMLGKRPARYDSRTLKLSKYTVKLPAPPPEVSWVTRVPVWPIMLNDQIGDCVEAAQGHMIEQWSFYANPPGIVPADADIVSAYTGEAGYDPLDPSTDNGTNMLDALNYWRQTGVAGHKILAFVAINPLNLRELFTAIWLFGNAFIGLQLPVAVAPTDATQAPPPWIVPPGGVNTQDGQPGSWGGHCVPVMAASPQSLTVVTWGQTLKMSHNFYRAYCDEAYAVLSSDWLSAAGQVSPENFNLAQLEADLQSITQV